MAVSETVGTAATSTGMSLSSLLRSPQGILGTLFASLGIGFGAHSVATTPLTAQSSDADIRRNSSGWTQIIGGLLTFGFILATPYLANTFKPKATPKVDAPIRAQQEPPPIPTENGPSVANPKSDRVPNSSAHDGMEFLDEGGYGKQTPPFIQVQNVAQKVQAKIDHITKVEFQIKGNGQYKFTGVHSKKAIDSAPNGARLEVTRPPNEAGVYEARVYAKDPNGVEVLKTGNSGKSTFFPDNWSEQKIMQEVEHAIKNNKGPVLNGGSNHYYGYSKDGKVRIEFYYDNATGSIRSFFPSLNP